MDQQRKVFLWVGAGGAAVALAGLVIFLSLHGRPNPTDNTPKLNAPAPTASKAKGNVPMVDYGGGVSVAKTHRELVAQGDEYGHRGEWQKAFECFRELVGSPNSVEYEWVCATASALAAGDTNASEQLCIQMMGTFGVSNVPAHAERFAKQCLALPHCSEALLDLAVERADYAIQKDRKSPWSQTVKAMAEYRQENWSSALDWARQVETSSDTGYSIMACCIGAMARYQLGDTAGARKALERVNALLKALVCTGKLGSWNDVARAIGVRAEAEQLILGKTSPPLNSAELVANRTKWQAISFSLNAADKMGKQGQWVPAASYYGKVLEDPAFDWSVSEVKQDLLSQKMATAFLLAGDQTRYCELVRALLARNAENFSPVMLERCAQIFVSNTEFLTPELKTQTLAYARRVCDAPEAGDSPWIRLLRGETEYREGRYETAIETLGQVFFSPSESDGAARAMTYKAMAYKKLGRTKEAVDATQEATALFAKQSARSGDWTNPAFYQIAMKELLGFLANPTESKKSQ